GIWRRSTRATSEKSGWMYPSSMRRSSPAPAAPGAPALARLARVRLGPDDLQARDGRAEPRPVLAGEPRRALPRRGEDAPVAALDQGDLLPGEALAVPDRDPQRAVPRDGELLGRREPPAAAVPGAVAREEGLDRRVAVDDDLEARRGLPGDAVDD